MHFASNQYSQGEVDRGWGVCVEVGAAARLGVCQRAGLGDRCRYVGGRWGSGEPAGRGTARAEQRRTGEPRCRSSRGGRGEVREERGHIRGRLIAFLPPRWMEPLER